MSNQRLQGKLRPAFYFSSRMALFLLLAVPSAFSQQQKPPSAPESAPKPMNVVVSETNDRIAQLALASDVKQGDYVIGSGDLLGIEVFDVPELSRDVRVNETGYISLPLMPSKVRAGGLTPFQLQDKLAELLQTNGLVSTPQVTVSVKEQHSQPITVIGAVKNSDGDPGGAPDNAPPGAVAGWRHRGRRWHLRDRYTPCPERLRVSGSR